MKTPTLPTRAWLNAETQAILPLSPENTARARLFLLDKWKERALERNEPEPDDLAHSCKFVTLFVKCIFGGRIRGSFLHQFNLIGGEIVDLNKDAADVRSLPDAHRHDEIFFANPDHIESLSSCMPRVRRWVDEFLGRERVSISTAHETASSAPHIHGNAGRMSKNLIIGIDPGLTTTGYAIIEIADNGLRSIDSGSVSSDESIPIAARLLKIAELLEPALVRHRPSHAAIEAGFVGRGPGSAIKLAQVSGACIATLARFGLDVESFAPRTIKLETTGCGVAGKTRVEVSVRALVLNANPVNEHIADAYAVAVTMAIKTGFILPNARYSGVC